MSPPRTTLLTGGTGFLGTLMAKRLLTEGGRTYVLVRAQGAEEAAARLHNAWWEWPELTAAIGRELVPLAGDVRQASLGLSHEDLGLIRREVEVIINAAADLRIEASLEELRETNVQGTRHLLDLAKMIDLDGRLWRFSQISTAYVCGRAQGEISEDDLGSDFSNDYERSKAEGESLVRGSGLPFTVFRPVMVVGETERGWIRTFNTLYYPLRLYLTGRIRLMPVDPLCKVNMVPGDMASDAVVRVTMDPRGAGRTLHLVPPPEMLPTVREMMDLVREWASSRLGVELRRGRFLDLPGRSRAFLVSAAGGMAKLRGKEGDMRPLLSYLEQGQVFRRDAWDELLEPPHYDWRLHLNKMLEFGTRYGFMHRTERTVQEQLHFRLGRSKRAVRIFDIVDGQLVEREAASVKEDITWAARALMSLGVSKGDRVAVVGLNSARYLIVEAAIGLAGAVSVPLYYTSPLSDIRAIMQDSGAKVLLVGAPRFMELPKDLPGVTCVSFLRQGKAEGAMGWDEFLGLGKEAKELPHVRLDDLATIRYTSGTTGMPQGVVFDHANLRWMAETIASLPPWSARNKEVRYLSFLPMNHVVEGILGTYSPYYAPAPLRLYFLEDLRSLPSALPLVRPNIFFSVPRFYEKLWDRFQGSVLGRVRRRPGSALRSGRWNRSLGQLLLRKAGLDRCDQLIVGSAPCSDELLADLRSIGIEVHNAYGLTEAPLITLNRVGRNRIGTVGEPLPETEVRTTAQGEIEVRGGQVMRGHHPLSGDGRTDWLSTGDLGRITEDGSLVIEGRIKEMMIDSYGKSIMPVKVESALRQVPGVAEAMFIVDGRPYGTAILWVEKDQLDRPGAHWDDGVRKAGLELAGPERPKAWAVLPYDLNIEKGEMTANLKLRRKVLMAKHHDIIRCLYSEGPVPSNVAHLGREAER